MIPKYLRLKGFAGILCGFGREELTLDLRTIPADAALVALIGPNGAGKTTILENLHPYRCMPSHSTTLGPGGFSYWDVIDSATATKELEWEHGGIDYRTVLSFRTAGKTQKADCYLYQRVAYTQDWAPVSLADGTLSDGKAATYDACVDDILGPPERFFTAQFSSQKRKTLADYDVKDIKSILASVLNLDDFRGLSQKAGQVARFIKQRLDGLNGELAEARQHEVQFTLASEELARIDRSIVSADADVQAGMVMVERASNDLAVREAKRNAQARDNEERTFLNAQITSAKEKSAARRAEVEREFDGKRRTLAAEVAACTNEQTQVRQAITPSRQELVRLQGVLGQRAGIDGAIQMLSQAKAALAGVEKAIDQHKALLAGAAAARSAMQKLVTQKATLQSEGVAQRTALDKLAATAALVTEVPCGGTGLQGQCKLLVNAREAAEAIPVKTAELDAKRTAHDQVKETITALQAKLDEYAAGEAELDRLQMRHRTLSTQISEATATAAKLPMLEDADRRLPLVESELAQQQSALNAATERASALQEQVRLLDAHAVQTLDTITTTLNSEIKEYQDRLNALAEPVTEAQINEAKGWVENANRGLQQYRGRLTALNEQKIAMVGKLEAARALAARSSQTKLMAERCADEIAFWKRLEKGLGNDGCVALCIDDAGPEIASICNQLLKDCFGGRFAVRLDTQAEQKNGNQRETFEVTVFDSLRDTKGKPLGRMSGGEEVFVNECLTRAIALHAAQSSTANYQTLFTDESDGALDPKAKRTFVAMKRAVLKQGGYQREYFVSHTPELWGLADYTIDVAKL